MGPMNFKPLSFSLTLVLLCSLCSFSYAGTITSNTITGNWSSTASWIGGVVPGTNDDVIINGNITATSTTGCLSLVVESGKSLTINSGITLSVIRSAVNNWNNEFTLKNSGSITLATGGSNQLNISLPQNQRWSVFINNGTFTGNTGTLSVTNQSNGALIENNGTFNSTTLVLLNGSNNVASVTGTVTFQSVTVSNIQQLNLAGSVTVNGTLKLTNGAYFSGNNNNHPIYGSNAVLEIYGSYSPSTNPYLWATTNTSRLAPNIKIMSGTITASQGSMYLKGTLSIASGATFNGSAGCFFFASGFQSITNEGTFSMGGTTVQNGATWNVNANYSLATLKIENGATVNANSYVLTINNSSINNCGGISGIMQMETGGAFNSGTSTVVFNPAFNSNITADVSGPINFTNLVVTGTAPIVIPTTNTVTVSGNVTVNPGATVNNSTNIVFDSSATVTNNGTPPSGSNNTFPTTVPSTPTTPSGNYLTGNVSGNKAGAASIQAGNAVVLTGNMNVNTGTSKTLTVAPGAELTLGTYTVTADTVYVYGKLNVSNAGGMASSFLRSAGSPVIILGSGSTITYSNASAQTITARTDYVNLALSGAGAKTFAAGSYTIGGDFTLAGGGVDITTNSTTFNFDGDNAQTIKGLPYKNVSFGGTGNKILTDSTNITGVVTLSGSAKLVSNGLVTLKSNASGTASLGTISGTATITGNINYERYIPAGRLWRFIGWPIKGNTFANSWQQQIYITGAGSGGSLGGTTNVNGFDFTASKEPGLYYYKENATGAIGTRWTTVPQTSDTINSYMGYRLYIRGDRSQGIVQLNGSTYTPGAVTLKGSGSPNMGDINIPLTCSNSCGADDGWNFLSNPYPSAIDWNNTTWKAARANNISAAVYVFNPSLNQYSVWMNGTTPVNGGSNIIASGQSFWIKTTGNATLALKEAYKVGTGTSGLFGKSDGVEDNLKIGIGDNTKVYDEAVIYMNPNATYNYDGLDATKSGTGNATISTYTALNGTKLVYNAIPVLGTTNDSATINLYTPLANATYTYNLTFSGMETFTNANTQFALVDNYTGSSMLMSTTYSVYSFNTVANSSASYNANRFIIKIITTSGSLPVKLISFSGKKSNKTSVLRWATASEVNNDKFEIERSNDGKTFTTIGMVDGADYSNKLINYTFTDETPELNAVNYYRLKQIDHDGSSTLSTVITLNFNETAKAAMSVWPVPANDFITLELNNSSAVYATVNVTDMLGKVISTEKVLADETNYSHRIAINNLRSGVYFVEIILNDGSTQSIKFIKG
jgi:hypothetical protein